MVAGPARGEVWYGNMDPTIGHEQAGRRPLLVVSVDDFNRTPAELVIVVPLTSRRRRLITHVPIDPPEGGVTHPSDILCESVRCISKLRLSRRMGAVSPATIREVEARLRLLLFPEASGT